LGAVVRLKLRAIADWTVFASHRLSRGNPLSWAASWERAIWSNRKMKISHVTPTVRNGGEFPKPSPVGPPGNSANIRSGEHLRLDKQLFPLVFLRLTDVANWRLIELKNEAGRSVLPHVTLRADQVRGEGTWNSVG